MAERSAREASSSVSSGLERIRSRDMATPFAQASNTISVGSIGNGMGCGFMPIC